MSSRSEYQRTLNAVQENSGINLIADPQRSAEVIEKPRTVGVNLDADVEVVDDTGERLEQETGSRLQDVNATKARSIDC